MEHKKKKKKQTKSIQLSLYLEEASLCGSFYIPTLFTHYSIIYTEFAVLLIVLQP